MLHAFLDTEDIARCDSLRDVMCSGEALPIEVKNRFLSDHKVDFIISMGRPKRP